MNLKRIKDKIQTNALKSENIKDAKRYYRNENDILDTGVIPKGENKDPLRTADNRISHNLHEILVDEKASYLFTYPILIDIDNNNEINEKINDILGQDYPRKMKNQCIEASNCGTSWLHYWIDSPAPRLESENVEADGKFKYALVPTEQIIPIYDNGLERDLKGIIRHFSVYEYVEEEEKEKQFKYVEYWNEDSFEYWKFENEADINESSFIENIKVNHMLEEVPFIEFANNIKKQSDLSKYKQLIDLRDRVMSGFANDLDDIQQIIYILENYGGADLGEFLTDLKRYKAIKTESDGTGGSGGVKTLQIDIPVEARKVILDILQKQIYESAQGLQQDVESVGQASGVALKFFYRKLELKSGLMETEFRSSIDKLIRAILRYLNIEAYKITQTWTRNMISNDLENAQIAQISVGIIPRKLTLRNHPWVDDEVEAEELMKEEKEGLLDDYFAKEKNNGEVDET